MTNGGAVAAAAAIANAIKASGVVVRLSPDVFESLCTKSSEPIRLPAHVETIRAAKIWVPE